MTVEEARLMWIKAIKEFFDKGGNSIAFTTKEKK